MLLFTTLDRFCPLLPTFLVNFTTFLWWWLLWWNKAPRFSNWASQSIVCYPRAHAPPLPSFIGGKWRYKKSPFEKKKKKKKKKGGENSGADFTLITRGTKGTPLFEDKAVLSRPSIHKINKDDRSPRFRLSYPSLFLGLSCHLQYQDTIKSNRIVSERQTSQ